ncbi:MAG: hypothetical protein EXS03_08885 [Phycisphaerales bacterium]|nr:hypothetical protein [Phycisphaerales bacterium]
MGNQPGVRFSAEGPWSLGSGAQGVPGGPAKREGAPAAGAQTGQVQLTRHEKRTFVAQTVHLAGNAFVDCTFDGCTLVLTNAPFVFSGQCKVQRCNWRVEFDVLWGVPGTRAQLRQILDSMEAPSEPPPTA